MAALSFFSNWDMLPQKLNPGITSSGSFFQTTETEPELLFAPELHAFHDEFTLADTCIDPLFEPANNEFIISSADSYPPFLPQLWPHDPSNYDDCSICFRPQDFEKCGQFPKRRKHYQQDQFYSDSTMPACFFDGYVTDSTTNPSVPHLSTAYACGSSYNSKKSNGGSLSAQSVAARRRRKKITEKTEELGKLVPGGRKMNTAEMFQAAFKYVKYLQAQVGMLQLMGPIQNDDPLWHQEDLQVLLASPIIQEKLYSEEKCLVPERLLHKLSNDSEIQFELFNHDENQSVAQD